MVADTADVADLDGGREGSCQLLADAVDHALHDRVVRAEVGHAPDFLDQLRRTDDPVGVDRQVAEEAELERREVDPLGAGERVMAVQEEAEPADRELAVGRARAPTKSRDMRVAT